MRKLVMIAGAALLVGCAHQGGVRDTRYEDRGYYQGEPATTGPGLPTTMERDFPGRIGPGLGSPVDPARPF